MVLCTLTARHYSNSQSLSLFYKGEREDDDEEPTDNIESEIDDGDLDEEVELKMPPKPKKSPKKPSASADDTIANDLAASVGGLSLENRLYNMANRDEHMVKEFTMNNKNYIEVDFFCPGILPEDFFRLEVIDDGTKLRYHRAMPEMFGEEGRLRKTMGSKYSQDNSRVVAHGRAVQQIRKDLKPKGKKVWSDVRDAQVVPLPAKCRTKIKKSWEATPSGQKVKDPTTSVEYPQFFMVLICRLETIEQPVEREKRGRVIIHGVISDSGSEDSDSDANN